MSFIELLLVLFLLLYFAFGKADYVNEHKLFGTIISKTNLVVSRIVNFRIVVPNERLTKLSVNSNAIMVEDKHVNLEIASFYYLEANLKVSIKRKREILEEITIIQNKQYYFELVRKVVKSNTTQK